MEQNSLSQRLLLLLLCSTYILWPTSADGTIGDPAPPYCAGEIVDNYAPNGTGKEVMIGDMNAYTAPNEAPKRALIAVYDIFGYAPHKFRQVVDVLSNSYGFRIIMPDFWKGDFWPYNVWPIDEMKDTNRTQWDDYWAKNGSWAVIKPRLEQTIKYIKDNWGEDVASNIGIFGICWGGWITHLTVQDTTLHNSIKAGFGLHPALFGTNPDSNTIGTTEGAKVKIPYAIIASIHEPEKGVKDMWAAMKTGLGAENFAPENTFFPDWFHGFAGQRANLSDPGLRRAQEGAIDLMGTFFNRILPAKI